MSDKICTKDGLRYYGKNCPRCELETKHIQSQGLNNKQIAQTLINLSKANKQQLKAFKTAINDQLNNKRGEK